MKWLLAALALVLVCAWLLLRARPPLDGATDVEWTSPPAERVELQASGASSLREARLAAPSPEEESPAPAGPEPMLSGIASAFHARVLDGLSGRPIPGVRVLAPEDRDVLPSLLPPAAILAQVRSDANGFFALPLEVLPEVGGAWLVAEGYGSVEFLFDHEHGSPEQADLLELLPGSGLVLEVTGGGALAGAQVEIWPRVSILFRAGRGLHSSRAHWSVSTGPDGTAWFADLPAEKPLGWSVRDAGSVRHGQVALAAGETRRLTVRLGVRSRVSGVAHEEAGLPVANLALALTSLEGEPVFTSTTDDSGAFEFDDVPFDTYTVDCAQDQPHERVLRERPAPFPVASEYVERDLVLVRGLYLSGRLVGPELERSELDSVQAQALGGGPDGSSAVLDSSFRIGPLAPGEYLVHAGGLGTATEAVRARAGDEGIELHLLPVVEARFRSSGGAVDLAIREDSGVWLTISSVIETAVLLNPGVYSVLATTKNDRVAFLPRLVVAAGVSLPEVVLEPSAGARCTVVHRAQSGPGQVRVRCRGGALPLSLFQESELLPEGSLSFLAPAGAMTVELSVEDRMVTLAELVLAPGERRRVVLEPR